MTAITPLRHGPFRRYLIGQTLSAFGDSLLPIALVFAVLGQGGDATAVGIVLLASRIPAILLVLFGGAIGDRFDRRRVLVATDLARSGFQAVTAVQLLTGHAPLWALAGSQALAGAASALFGPASAGLVRTLLPAASLAQGNALLGLGRNLVGVTGLAAAGALVTTVGAGWAFAVDAATFAASALFLARLPVLPPPVAGPSLRRAVLVGVRAVFARRWLWPSIGYVAVLNLVAVCPFLVLGPVIADAVLGGPRAWTTIAVGYAIGGIGGSAVALRWRPRHPLRAAFVAALGLSPFLFLLGAAAPVPAITTAALLAGAQASVFNVFHGTTLQTQVPAHLVSRVSSVNLLGALAAVPLGLALAGPLAAATSDQAVLTTGACCALIGTVAILLVPDVWRLPAATRTA